MEFNEVIKKIKNLLNGKDESISDYIKSLDEKYPFINLSKYNSDGDISLPEVLSILKEFETLEDIKAEENIIVNNPVTINNSNDSFRSAVLKNAVSDLNVVEDIGTDDGKRIREYFKHLSSPSGQPWCAAAVSKWLYDAGFSKVPGSLGALNLARQFQSINQFVEKGKVTKEHLLPGNIAFFTRPGPGAGHTGVILAGSTQGFSSIEGNSIPPGGNKTTSVTINSHSINDGNFIGIGLVE